MSASVFGESFNLGEECGALMEHLPVRQVEAQELLWPLRAMQATRVCIFGVLTAAGPELSSHGR